MEELLKNVDSYYQSCQDSLIKISRIKKMPDGKYRVVSKENKNLGTYTSKSSAEKRLRQVEYFKHLDESNANDKSTMIDLTGIDDFSYSAMARKIKEKSSKEQFIQFLTLYKKSFDKAVKDKLHKPEKIALQNTLVKLNKMFKVKLDKEMIKHAAVVELGDAALVGKYLSNIVKFTLNKIIPEKRPQAIDSLKKKLYSLDEKDLSMKNLPPTSAIGQSITFIKHVLFNHDASYIRDVLNSLVKYL